MKHLLHYAALGLLLSACSKGSDPAPGSNSSSTGTTTGGSGTTTTPAAKSHTLTFNFVNNGLDNKRINLGGGIRIYVDKKALLLGSAVDTTYYLAPQDGTGTYAKTLTVTGSTLTVEAGLYNVWGTAAQPRDKAGAALALPTTRIMVVPVVDGKVVTNPSLTLGAYSTTPAWTYDNSKNPTKIVDFDLTQL